MSIQPLEGSLGSTPLSPFTGIGGGANPLAQDSVSGTPSGDAISRMVPPWLANSMSNPVQTAMFGPLPGLLQQLLQMLQQMTGGGGLPYGNGGAGFPGGGQPSCPPYGNEQFFANANGSSEGDPHLCFNGNKWNSMVSHPNLLDSNSIPGGFRLSTQVTAPNERGVTRNQSATIALNNGATTISMNNSGQATIESYGRNLSVNAGQTVQLGNGATATYGANGQLTVTACNAMGGRITTTLAAKGGGVNVDVNAHDVDLGGALVRGEQMQPGAVPAPFPGPYPGPIPSPIPDPISTPFVQPFTGSMLQAPSPAAAPTPYPDAVQLYNDGAN
jgi:hypothetical protein